MNHPIPPALRGDYAACAQLARSHYENFPVASHLLPPTARPHIAALYAFARTADDFADEPRYEGNRLVELDRWERDFKLALANKPAHPFCRAFAHSVTAFGIPPELPLKLLTAFRMDVKTKRWKDWDALLHYCSHSADPVGRCVLAFCGVGEERLFRLSDKVCTGLQLINFWQDSSVDLANGRIYYPKSEWKLHQLREPDFRDPLGSAKVRALVKSSVDRTETLFREGFPLAEAVPGRLKWELKGTFQGGLAILAKIRRMDYNVYAARPQLNAWDKARILASTLLG